MTRKNIEQIYYLSKQLEIWQRKLNDIQADIALSPRVLDGMPYSKTNKTGDPTQAMAIKLAEVSKIVEGKIAEIQYAILEVEEYLASIEDPLVSQIIEFRCRDLMTWNEVAFMIGGNHTAESVRQIYHRYVDSLERE